MAEVSQTSAPRPITPAANQLNASRSSSMQMLSSSTQPLPLQTSFNTRPLSNLGPLSPVNNNGSFAFDRVIRRGKVDRRVKKKGAWKASWKPVYLVLRPNLLSVYKDADETELRASITLSDVTAVAPVKKSNHEHVFGVFSPAKNHHFSGMSATDTADWIAIIRSETLTGSQTDLQPPNAGFQQGDGHGYETTDLSADDDIEAPGSPEATWNVKANKNRVMPPTSSADPRKASSLAPYPSGNDSFATSQSDFSDHFSSSTPGNKGYLSAAGAVQPSTLTTIPDNVATNARPVVNRATSYLSDTAETPQQMFSRSVPKQGFPSSLASDPSRVVRQGHLKLAKTTSGVRQWKSVWVVLRASTLAFYKGNNEYSPIIIIPVYSIIEAAEIDRKNKQNCFQVISEEKTYRLQAETEDELESWLGAFKSLLVKQEADRSRSRGPSISLQGDAIATQKPMQPPSSREGLGGISAQLQAASLNDMAVQGSKRVMSPPTMGSGTGPSAHAQTTTPAAGVYS